MSIRPYILSELNWKEIKESEYRVAILPWGATEAHNYHLPYCTDVFQSEFIAEESAKIAYEKGAKVIVLPAISFGVNTNFKNGKFLIISSFIILLTTITRSIFLKHLSSSFL